MFKTMNIHFKVFFYMHVLYFRRTFTSILLAQMSILFPNVHMLFLSESDNYTNTYYTRVQHMSGPMSGL